MQSFTDITDDTFLSDSLALLMNNDKTLMSGHAGTSFPTTNLEAGMACFRTDQFKLYRLKDLTPTWVLVADLTKTYISKEAADGFYQPLVAILTAIAGLSADGVIEKTGSSASVFTITAAAKTLLDDPDVASMRTTLGLGDSATKNVGVLGGVQAYNAKTAYIDTPQSWTTPQRPQSKSTASVTGTVTLDMATYNDFDLTLTGALTLANPTITTAMVGQRGRIRFIQDATGGRTLAALGTYFKRIGSTGAPTLSTMATAIDRMDYEVVSTGRIEYSFGAVEA